MLRVTGRKKAQQEEFTLRMVNVLITSSNPSNGSKKAKLNNKTKESCWKLLHRKLYAEENDGGITIIYLSSLANKIWNIINNAWSKWTKQHHKNLSLTLIQNITTQKTRLQQSQ